MGKLALLSGILAPLLYFAMLIFIPMGWDEYSSITFTVSKLSAIGAPTRAIWVPFGVVYALLMIFFGWGVRAAGSRSAGIGASVGGNPPLRKVGIFLMVSGLLSVFWPPMHLRGETFTATDAWHIAFAMATVLLMILSTVYGALAFGRKFRICSFLTLGVMVISGIFTSLQSPDIARNLPTPTIGVWERISIVANMTWNGVLAVMLLRAR